MLFGEIFSAPDIAVVLIVVLLLFGGRKLPQLARSLGSASSEFKKGIEEGAGTTGSSAPVDEVKSEQPKTTDQQQ
jgi:sec-independent protein translocase protein TatA